MKSLCDKKILVASFQYEACTFSQSLPEELDFEVCYGRDIFSKLAVKEVFEKEGMKIVPSLYANALPGGKLGLQLYNKYKNIIIEDVKKNVDLSAIFIYFHGSMEVEGIGSGELNLLKEIRSIVGNSPLIAACFDLHANMDVRIVDYASIICGYKTAPHTDQEQTQLRAATALIKCLKQSVKPISVIYPLPMLPMGDAMLTQVEPLKSLMKLTEKHETNSEILSANLFFGHMWVDAPNARSSVVVSANNINTARVIAESLAKAFWNSRKDYKLKVECLSAKESVQTAIKYADTSKGERVFITDSGDNTTAGADGMSTDILFEFLESNVQCSGSVCVAGITNSTVVKSCETLKDGDALKVVINKKQYQAEFVCKGKILGWAKDIIGKSVSLKIKGITVIFCEKRSAFISCENFLCAGEKLDMFSIIVVKLGYLFDELKPYCHKHIFALTKGASCVDIKKHNYTNLKRPIFPLDEFEII